MFRVQTVLFPNPTVIAQVRGSFWIFWFLDFRCAVRERPLAKRRPESGERYDPHIQLPIKPFAILQNHPRRMPLTFTMAYTSCTPAITLARRSLGCGFRQLAAHRSFRYSSSSGVTYGYCDRPGGAVHKSNPQGKRWLSSSVRDSDNTSTVWLRIILFSDVYELDAFPSLKTLIDCHKDGPQNATIVAVAGDFLAPSLLSSLDKGAAMVDCLNAVGVTHVSLGNHETDVGMKALRDRYSQSNFCWINTNMRDLDDKISVVTPECEIMTVANNCGISKRIGLLGLLTHNPGLYRPGSFGGAYIEPVTKATSRAIETYKDKVDSLIPLTHQGIAEDRTFATTFPGVFPVILGSHDHDVVDEAVQGSRILQTGMDAENAAIIDLKWKADTSTVAVSSRSKSESTSSNSQPEVSVKVLTTANFEPDASVAQRVKGHQKILKELEQAPLFRIQEWIDFAISDCKRMRLKSKPTSFSTQGNRLGPSTGTTALSSLLRMGMAAQCAIISAGAVRANKVYNNADFFTWSDLKAEILFPTHMTACYIPGSVLEATIAHSRAASRQDTPIARGGYLHTCNHIEFNDENQCIESMSGEAFDPKKSYLTALPTCFFSGIDHHQPLLEWAADQNLEISDESGIPAKMVLVQFLATLIWLELGSFDELDRDQKGVLHRDDIKARFVKVYGLEVADMAVDSIFSVADLNGDGVITPLEMKIIRYFGMAMMSHDTEELKVVKEAALQTFGKDASEKEVKEMVGVIRDKVGIAEDGKLSHEGIMKAMREFKVAKELLT